MIEWLPLIVASIGLVGGAIVYQFQKFIDRRSQLQTERRQTYRDFVVAIERLKLSIYLNDRMEAQSAYKDVNSNFSILLISAPDSVVDKLIAFEKCLAQFVRMYMENQLDRDNKFLLKVDVAGGEVIDAMRDDTISGSGIQLSAIRDMIVEIGRVSRQLFD